MIYNKEDIIRLRKEGKKYREISEILGCSKSIITYHLGYGDRLNERLRNKEKARADNDKYISEYKTRNCKFIENYLQEHPCVDCGNDDIRVLEFDHVRGEKKAHVSYLVKNGYPIDRIIEEIDKCDVRCANCHRIKTKENNDYCNRYNK